MTWGYVDSKLKTLLASVGLDYLIEWEGGWDVEKDWNSILAGGDKQKIAMVRLFYHKPLFAILDECSSAVSVRDEEIMYSKCKELGITLITISHRKSLVQFHQWVLRYDGWKNVSVEKIN